MKRVWPCTEVAGTSRSASARLLPVHGGGRGRDASGTHPGCDVKERWVASPMRESSGKLDAVGTLRESGVRMTLEQLGEAEPRLVERSLEQSDHSRARGRRSRRKPRLGGRAELTASRPPAGRMQCGSSGRRPHGHPESDQAAATLDALASSCCRGWSGAGSVTSPTCPPDSRDGLPPTHGPAVRHAVIDAMGVAVLRHRLHGETLGGKKLDVRPCSRTAHISPPFPVPSAKPAQPTSCPPGPP